MHQPRSWLPRPYRSPPAPPSNGYSSASTRPRKQEPQVEKPTTDDAVIEPQVEETTPEPVAEAPETTTPEQTDEGAES